MQKVNDEQLQEIRDIRQQLREQAANPDPELVERLQTLVEETDCVEEIELPE